jgi:DNA-binding transcriptional MerR regulator
VDSGVSAGAAIPGHRPPYRIGEVAELAGVSTRTLRYYEEIGLLEPAGHSPGGSRRYDEASLSRLQRIRELRYMLGFDLEQIGEVLRAEDRLEQLRTEFRSGKARSREAALILEAIEINRRVRAQLREKLVALQEFVNELDAAASRYQAAAAERGIETDGLATSPT